jgi:hypothetical protein
MLIHFLSERFGIDRDLLVAYSNGLVLGGLILSTLILFPGRNNHEAIRNDSSTKQSIVSTEPIQRETTSTKTTSHNHFRQPRPSDPTDYGYWTPHRRLNTAVYVILIGIVATVWYAEYTDKSNDVRHPMTLIKMLLRTYFPREANLLLGQQRGR